MFNSGQFNTQQYNSGGGNSLVVAVARFITYFKRIRPVRRPIHIGGYRGSNNTNPSQQTDN